MTKDSVLMILRNADHYISGEKISQLLGVSRAAVNIAVKTLRADGYEILSSTKKGYFLSSVPDRLTPQELAAYLDDQRMKTVLCVDSIDSTNNKIRELAVCGAPAGQVVIANEQQNGRGRCGRAFVSPRDQGIYLSMLLYPNGKSYDIAKISAWAAVAVNNAIQSVCGVRAAIRQVNDLVLNQKKLCGILTEMSVESESGYIQYAAIGIGIHVNEKKADFPEEIRNDATSLAVEMQTEYSRAQLASEIIKELDILCSVWLKEEQSYQELYQKDHMTGGEGGI